MVKMRAYLTTKCYHYPFKHSFWIIINYILILIILSIMLLESKSKFDIRSPTRDRPFSPDNFFVWSNQHMYRTSYSDMGFLKVLTCQFQFYRVHQQKKMWRYPNTKGIFQEKWLTMSLGLLSQTFREGYYLLKS